MRLKVNSFTKHPEEVGMTYWQHSRFAMNLAKLTFKACFASVIHAFFPFLFVNTTSKIAFTMYNLLKSRFPTDDAQPVGNKNTIHIQSEGSLRKTGS